MAIETFDFVIIGGGGGGLCAALALRAADRTVLVLEKDALVGGTTALSGGVMWVPANRFMQEAGIADSVEQAVAYLDAVVGDSADMPGSTPKRRRAYVEQAPQMLEFLIQQGIRLRRIPSWPDYYDKPGASGQGRAVVPELFDVRRLGEWRTRLRPGFVPLPAHLDEAMQLVLVKRSGAAKKVLLRVLGRALADRLTGRRRVSAGEALQGQMLHAALRAGADIRPSTPVMKLLVEGDRVTGVIAQRDGEALTIAARLGVLINAGGFARNQRMLDQWIPGTSADWSSAVSGDTGEMIEEGQRIGAALAQMGERIGMEVALPPGSSERQVKAPMQNDVSKPHAIAVDQTGARFVNEACSHPEFTLRMRERQAVAAGPAYFVCDSQFRAKYMLVGTMPGRSVPASWTEESFLRRGDTPEALAEACNIDPAALRSTIERWNGFVRAGHDADFSRGDHPYDRWVGDSLHKAPANTLGTIEVAPYYAVQLWPGDVGTFGGLVTDEHARVLRPDGSVIEGLYATGTSTASVMGRVEPGAGGSIGPSFTFGYLAARHAARQRFDAVSASSEES